MKKLIDEYLKKLGQVPSTVNKDHNNDDPSVLKFLNTEYLITDEWLDLFTHFILLDKHNKMPLKSWYTETKELIDKIGKEAFLSTGINWILDCIEKSKENQERYKELGPLAANEQMQKDLGFKKGAIPEWVVKVYGEGIVKGGFFKEQEAYYLNQTQNYFYQSLGGRILRGFLQSALIHQDPRLIELVDQIALISPNSSQDPIHIYSQLPPEIGIPRLTKLKAKAKHKNILKRIDKAIAIIGKKSGQSKAEVEESVVPDYGLNGDSMLSQSIGDVDCIFHVRNFKESEIYYMTGDGKKQKTTPKNIKENFPNELKEFKIKIKEIKASISGQRKRIEAFYLINRSIPYLTFIQHYFDNPLVKILAKDLIWNFKSKDIDSNLIFDQGKFVDTEGQPNKEILEECQVSLWHPIGHESEYILKWRDYILKQQIFQPFKQAFREIYIITEAELNTETYSNRFASHILNKDHVSALCKVRGWSPSGISNYGKATYKIPESDFKVEYWVNEIDLGEDSKMYGSAHISTDQLRFYKKKGQMKLAEVPEVLFSEVMRDVDMFVGVTSIGNDPEWYDRGNEGSRNYWSTYTNSELTERSKTRVEILKNIIPKMRIADRCTFSGKFLKVKGELRNYKIHMGSGNIMMEPEDQYLCIVADRSTNKLKQVFIPFEGDNLLSIIISKALLLARDSKIKDPTITRQINRK